MKNKMRGFRFFEIVGVLLVFLLIATLLFLERMGVIINDSSLKDPYLKPEDVILCEDAMKDIPSECLVITDYGREDCVNAADQLRQIFHDMRVNYDKVDLGCETIPEDFSKYKTMVILTPDIEAIGERVFDITEWVSGGGRLAVVMTVEHGPYMNYLLRKTGVVDYSEYAFVEDIYLSEDFMIAGGRSFKLDDPFDSSLNVKVSDDTTVYAWAGKRGGIPLVWSHDYGKGRISVANFGFYEKAFRGLYSATYLTLEDVGAYPVLNGSVMFLDDMPSPVPLGDSQYIYRDYKMSIADYYLSVWFPDVENLSKKYNIPLTGLVIENYENAVDGSIIKQTETTRFSYFGNLILRNGGELGYHGFNHQPLCLGNVDYRGEFDYKTWESPEAMSNGIEELMRFCEELYPTTTMSVYVPPSNILSKEGREYLGSLYPMIRTISGSYLKDETEYPYTQEFGVAKDGIVELPRVTSGSILDNYMHLAACSELNMHLVVSHFMHPDDAMDVDRGAEIGWPTLYQNLLRFYDWIYDSAPMLRGLDSAHLSATIQKWESLTVTKTWNDDGSLSIDLGNYRDEAFLLMRFNKGVPTKVSGGKIEKISESLYLLTAESDHVVFEWGE